MPDVIFKVLDLSAHHASFHPILCFGYPIERLLIPHQGCFAQLDRFFRKFDFYLRLVFKLGLTAALGKLELERDVDAII